jgi:predicted DNA-binding WGR domain protein
MCQGLFRNNTRIVDGILKGSPLPQAVEGGIRLVRIDPERNMQRYYDLNYEQDLFGHWLLVRQWGRIGLSARRTEIVVGDPREAVRVALVLALKKMKKGYRLDRGRSREIRKGAIRSVRTPV